MRLYLLPALIFPFSLSFLLNFYNHHNLLISLLNSASLTLSIYISRDYLSLKSFSNLLIIVSLGILPLFYFQPSSVLISFLPLLSISIIASYKYFRFSKKWLLTFWAIFLLIGNFYSGEVIRFPFNIESTQIIFNSPEINYHIQRHQMDALFIPYQLRLIMYSWTVFFYAILTNFFNFLTIKNISDVLLLCNLYPLFLGVKKILTEKNDFKNFIIISFLIIVLTGGIDRSADKFQSLYLLGPIFIYLITTGIQMINKKIYFLAFILSLFILLSPKI